MTERFELIWETDEMCNVFDNDLDVNSTLSVEEVVDKLNELYEDKQKLQKIIWNTLNKHIKFYKKMAEKHEQSLTPARQGKTVYLLARQRLTALQDLHDDIFSQWTIHVTKDMPHLLNCRCVSIPYECDENDQQEDENYDG